MQQEERAKNDMQDAGSMEEGTQDTCKSEERRDHPPIENAPSLAGTPNTEEVEQVQEQVEEEGEAEGSSPVVQQSDVEEYSITEEETTDQLVSTGLPKTVLSPSDIKLGQEDREVLVSSSRKSLLDSIETLARAVPTSRLQVISNLQETIMSDMKAANKMLADFNLFSEEKYASISPEIVKLAKNLKTVKSDLDYIYKKTRAIRTKLRTKYPNAF